MGEGDLIRSPCLHGRDSASLGRRVSAFALEPGIARVRLVRLCVSRVADPCPPGAHLFQQCSFPCVECPLSPPSPALQEGIRDDGCTSHVLCSGPLPSGSTSFLSRVSLLVSSVRFRPGARHRASASVHPHASGHVLSSGPRHRRVFFLWLERWLLMIALLEDIG